jgi:hypothetical protein
MAEEAWERARLIPVSGISGAEEQERRGVSGLLAALASVREFGRAITGPLGAPAGVMNCYIEVSFRSGDKTLRPDGVIQVSRAGRTWTCLVEVKTAANDLAVPQLEAYLDLAREQGFETVLTISNQITSLNADHPTLVDKRKLKKVNLRHLSWSQIHTEAEIQRVNRSVADPDQAWILSELIRYLEHPNSGARDFQTMGPSWVTVRNAVVDRALRANDPAAAAVADRYGQLVAFSAMRLSRNLGVLVFALPAADPTRAVQQAVTNLVEDGTLTESIRVPDALAAFDVSADLRAGRVSCSITVPAPSQGRQTTRVNWLTRQLAGAPSDVLIESRAAYSRGAGPIVTLAAAREDPSLLVADPQRDIKSFTLVMSTPAGAKRDQGRGSFADSVLTLVDNFYTAVVQPIRPWAAAAPKAKTATPIPGEPPSGPISGQLPTAKTTIPPATQQRSREELLGEPGHDDPSLGDSTTEQPVLVAPDAVPPEVPEQPRTNGANDLDER